MGKDIKFAKFVRINDKYIPYTSESDLISIQNDEIDRLKKIIIIMEKYFELIVDLGLDHDGFNESEDLKTLIDELVRFAGLGRAYNTTECIYINKNKKYNILNEEIKEK